ncbi:MAG: hypothetical protein R2704_10685 [Microthrixaceae bacterium]
MHRLRHLDGVGGRGEFGDHAVARAVDQGSCVLLDRHVDGGVEPPAQLGGGLGTVARQPLGGVDQVEREDRPPHRRVDLGRRTRRRPVRRAQPGRLDRLGQPLEHLRAHRLEGDPRGFPRLQHRDQQVGDHHLAGVGQVEQSGGLDDGLAHMAVVGDRHLTDAECLAKLRNRAPEVVGGQAGDPGFGEHGDRSRRPVAVDHLAAVSDHQVVDARAHPGLP